MGVGLARAMWSRWGWDQLGPCGQGGGGAS